MGRTTARKQQHKNVETPRETVPEHVYGDIDFSAFNSKVSQFRNVTESEGFDASFSKFTGVPTAVIQHDARTL